MTTPRSNTDTACPRCGATSTARIMYGYPAFGSDLQEEIAAGRLVLGGCIIQYGQPDHACTKCGHQFRVDAERDRMGHVTNSDDASNRRVSLRAERDGSDSRYLDAYMDDEGNLHIDGQDLGPGTAIVSSDGEYEWFEVIPAADLPRLRELLGANPGERILDVLERSFTGPRSYELERILRESDIHVSRHVWSG